MAQHPKLKADKRTVLGKKVKSLRRDGLLPANVYGHDLASTAVQVNLKEFEAVYKETGETGLVDLQVDGTAKPVLIKNYQIAYPFHTPLHVDFYQVNLKEKVKTMVPLEVVGEALAVKDNVGMLMHPISEVEVEALPADLPENIIVNIEHLAAIDDAITVADLSVPQGVTILTDPGQTVAKVAELVAPEPEPEREAPAEGAEGEATAEGETPAAEGDAAEKASDEDKKEE